MGLVSQFFTALQGPQPTPLRDAPGGAETRVPFVAAVVRVTSPWGAAASYRVCHGWNELRCCHTGRPFRYHYDGWSSQAAG